MIILKEIKADRIDDSYVKEDQFETGYKEPIRYHQNQIILESNGNLFVLEFDDISVLYMACEKIKEFANELEINEDVLDESLLMLTWKDEKENWNKDVVLTHMMNHSIQGIKRL